MRRDDKAIITQIKWISRKEKKNSLKRKFYRIFMCEIEFLSWAKAEEIYDNFSLIPDESTVQGLRGASGRVPFWRFHVRRLQGNYLNVMKLSITLYDKFSLLWRCWSAPAKVGVIKIRWFTHKLCKDFRRLMLCTI